MDSHIRRSVAALVAGIGVVLLIAPVGGLVLVLKLVLLLVLGRLRHPSDLAPYAFPRGSMGTRGKMLLPWPIPLTKVVALIHSWFRQLGRMLGAE